MAQTYRTATFAITALTALAWLIAAAVAPADQAALTLGFIPARLSGAAVPWAAVPALLTPLSATLVHSGLVHLGFNLLVFVWCGTAVERILGKAGLITLYLVGAYAAALAQYAMDPMGMVPMVGASGAISAVMGAFALSFGRARMITRSPALNRWINAIWLLAMIGGFLCDRYNLNFPLLHYPLYFTAMLASLTIGSMRAAMSGGLEMWSSQRLK